MFFVLIYTLFGSHANFVEGKSLPYNDANKGTSIGTERSTRIP